MLEIAGLQTRSDTVVDLHYAESRSWTCPPELEAGHDDTPVDWAFVSFGAESVGPTLMLVTMGPGANYPDGDAHSHASDNWRISLRGELPMGKQRYGPGEFRFNAGWRAYPSDNASMGPDGGWSAVLFADRRGRRVRPVGEVSQEMAEGLEMQSVLWNWVGLDGDVFDPDDTCGESCLVTTAGPLNNRGFLNGSFAEASAWRTDATGLAVAGAAMGHPTEGPLVLLLSIPPGCEGVPSRPVGTEVVRMVVDGTMSIDGQTYGAGAVRVEGSDVPWQPGTAGPDGVEQVLLLGDRRAVFAARGDGVWPPLVGGVVDELAGLVRDAAPVDA